MSRDLSVPRPLDLPTDVPLGPTADLTGLDGGKILAAPTDPADWPAWRATLTRWRDEARTRYDTAAAPGTDWSSRCFAVALVWLWDELLYDRATDTFTVERFLDHAAQFGGFDGIVLWQAYPIIGIDPRGQWDYYREVPDLPDLVAALQDRGLRVFVDYNPWDTGTRRHGADHETDLAQLVKAVGADGVFLDTLKNAAPELVAALGPVALEGESKVPLARISDHALSWAQWCADSDAPGVLAAHWFERRHMMHHTRRWNRDHSAELQSAWMNGVGIMVWECVFGVWVGWNARDRSTLRTMLPVQRLLAEHLVAADWTPLADPHPDAVAAGVYASRWEHGDLTLWTVVNRGDEPWTGPVVAVDPRPGETWLDVTADGPADLAALPVPAHGVLGLVRARGEVPAGLAHLGGPTESDSTFPVRPIERTPVPRVVGPRPTDTVRIEPGRRTLSVSYRVRETGQGTEAPWVDAWKPLPPELHAITRVEREVDIPHPVAVGVHEVSNAEFRRFRDTGGADDEPVTGVGLAEARAYAEWMGARLPTAAEWQVAMETGRLRRREPLVWNWTADEWTDGRTRACLLKGGSWYAAEGSEWYVDGGPRDPSWELKFLLPGAGQDRSPCIGFRIAVDLED